MQAIFLEYVALFMFEIFVSLTGELGALLSYHLNHPYLRKVNHFPKATGLSKVTHI